MSRAAEDLQLSQPAISLQIRDLETTLDTLLFERRGPKIKLTADGQTLYEMASPLIAGFDAIPARFASSRGILDAGEVNIAAGESTILHVLPDLIQSFRTRFSNIHLNLRNVTGRNGLSMLRAEEVDLAVGSMLNVPADIYYEPIVSYKPMLITPIDHPLAELSSVSPQDISEYGLILPPRGLSTWRMIGEVFKKQGLPFNVALEVGGWEVIKRYVALGMGVSIVTSICLTADDRLARFDMSRYFQHRSYGLVTLKNRFLTAPAKRFVELLKSEGLPQPNS